ncbi:hypothetical protein BVX97_05305 [bacterium E08(2017)]|nr:hypothetical protein BVX97_05305 [bacterium E08(2017)]
MISLGSPLMLLLFIPLAVAVWFVHREGRKRGLIFAAGRNLPPNDHTWRTFLAQTIQWLMLTGLGLAIIACARPRTVLSRFTQTSNVIAIEMVVDISASMEALDLSIKTPTGLKKRTRLDAVKETFAEFIEERGSDLIGLVTFGGYATTRAPLTTDHAALLHILKGVEIPRTRVDAQGRVYNREEMMTAIGDGLATACARIEKAEPVSKIIILLSDGESNTGIIRPEQAVEIASELGIKVYTIGIGSKDELAPVETKDFFGRAQIVQQRYPLDEETLKFIAESTGGQYFNVADDKGLEVAMQEIDQLEKTEIEKEVYEKYEELYASFLTPALLLIVMGTLINMLLTRRII